MSELIWVDVQVRVLNDVVNGNGMFSADVFCMSLIWAEVDEYIFFKLLGKMEQRMGSLLPAVERTTFHV